MFLITLHFHYTSTGTCTLYIKIKQELTKTQKFDIIIAIVSYPDFGFHVSHGCLMVLVDSPQLLNAFFSCIISQNFTLRFSL